MSLDESQLAMLNTLIYQPGLSEAYDCWSETRSDASVSAWDSSPTMRDLLTHMRDDFSSDAHDEYVSDAEYRTLVDEALADPQIANLSVSDFTESKRVPSVAPEQNREDYRQTGTNLTLSDGETGDLYIVFKGTEDAAEWQDNFEGLIETDTDSQRRAAAYADLMIDKYGTDDGQVIVSGHSKGGNKAAYTAVTDERVDACYSFDGQGFGSNFHQKYATQIAERRDKIFSYNYEGDFVSSLLIPVAGTIVFTASTQDGEGLGLLNNYARGDASFLPSNHAPFSLFESSSSLTLRDGGAPKDYWETINDFTTWVMNNVPERHQSAVVEVLSAAFGGDFLGYIEDHPKEFGVLVGVLADYPGLEELLRELAGSDLDLTAALGNPITNVGAHLGTNALIALLVQLLRNEGTRDVAAEAILDLLGLDVDDEWIAAFGAAGSDVRGAIASGERAQEAVLIRQTELRDWSDARKQELLQVVASVDAEPWYDCSTWDVTYRLQDFGAWLGLWDCERNIDQIIRRQIDLNDVHKADIERAFERAADVDAAYARSVRDMPAGIRASAELLRDVLRA